MKKVLFVQETLHGGGAERVLVDLLRYLDFEEFDVELLLLRRQGVYLDQVDSRVRVQHIFGDLSKNRGLRRKLMSGAYNLVCRYFMPFVANRYIKDRYDVAVACLEGYPTKLVADLPQQDCKKVAWIMNDPSVNRVFSPRANERLYQRMDAILCCSQGSKSKLEAMYPFATNKTVLLHQFVDRQRVVGNANEQAEQSEKACLTVVAVGRLEPQKRFDVLISAHRMLLDKDVQHRLLIVGEGREDASLKKLTKELGVESSVVFAGFQKNPHKYIAAGDVFAMSSDYEGLSVVMCEALVLGKAIVSTACNGSVELLEGGRCGLLVPCGNAQELAQALGKVLLDEELRITLQSKALARSYTMSEERFLSALNTVLRT